MSCIYHGRTKGEGCGHIKLLEVPQSYFTDHSKALLQLWFIISVIVFLCMYVLVKFLFWIAVWPIFVKDTMLVVF